MPSLEFHESLWDTPVREIAGKEIAGFLLAAGGNVISPTFFAHYVDGIVEPIIPPEGFPRPEPDSAVRTKRVVIPPSLRTRFPNVGQKQGGRYTGQMRRVVQCLNSRGLESRFGYGWARTHGILEFPYPRQIGSTAGEESVAFSKRRFWIIEISAAGVYAAPIGFGLQCMTCAAHLSEYLNPASGGDLDLAWAFVNKNESGKVQRVLHPDEIAPAYAIGSPWYQGMGWAFSVSGRTAANVVAKTINDGIANNLILDYYETRLISLSFAVQIEAVTCAIELVSPGVARVTLAAHGIADGQLAVVSGAEQAEYNGAHVAKNRTDNTFEFNLPGSPASPATGPVKVANATAPATITGDLLIGSPGRVTFRHGSEGTLWVPSGEALDQWSGIEPFRNTVQSSGPVHVFYDGEDQIVTTWSQSLSTTPEDKNMNPPFPPEDVVHAADRQALWDMGSGNLQMWVDNKDIHYVGPLPQYGGLPGCMFPYKVATFGSGHFYGGYIERSFGFSGPFSLAASMYTRKRATAATVPTGSHYRTPAQDYTLTEGYTICGTEDRCAAKWEHQRFHRNVDKTTVVRDEIGTGISALILLPTDREAVVGVHGNLTRFTDVTTVIHRRYQSKTHVEMTPVGDCPVENFDYENPVTGSTDAVGPATITTTTGEGGVVTFHLRASGGIQRQEIGIEGLAGFLTGYVPNTNEQVTSPLFFMRGGLNYADPNLSPAYQGGNHVFQRATTTFGGNFAAFPPGRVPVAFIGQV